MLYPEILCLFVHFWSSHIFLCCRCSNIYYCNLEHIVSFKGFFQKKDFFQKICHVCFQCNITALDPSSIRVSFFLLFFFWGRGVGCSGTIPNVCSTPLKWITLRWNQDLDDSLLSKTWSMTSWGLLLAAVVQVRDTESTLFKWPNVEWMRKSVVLWRWRP